MLLHLVDISSISGRDPVKDYKAINRELRSYDENLANRPQIVIATKIDALDEPQKLESLEKQVRKDGKDFFRISAVTKQGTKELVFSVSKKLDGNNQKANDPE